jgi:hypothetical protein
LGYRKFKKQSGERIRKLLAKHVPKSDADADSLHHFSQSLRGLKSRPWMANRWKQIDDIITAIEHEFPSNRSDSNAHQT